MKIKKKQQIAKKWFSKLQKLICKNIEELEKIYGSNKKFKKNRWKYGEYRTIEGEVIEKGGVAFSNVSGNACLLLSICLTRDLLQRHQLGKAIETDGNAGRTQKIAEGKFKTGGR